MSAGYWKNGRLVYRDRLGQEVVGYATAEKAKDPELLAELAERGLEIGRYNGHDPLGLKRARLMPIVLKVTS